MEENLSRIREKEDVSKEVFKVKIILILDMLTSVSVASPY